MSKWTAAHRIAQIAAQNARGAANLRHDQRADVIAMIDAAGVEVFGQHSSKLFGATIPASGERPLTIWLNSNSTATGQRHTAAHEWGHRMLGHPATCELKIASVPDDAETARGTTADPAWHAARTLPEVTAEAFAAWLLMPRSALRSALRAIGANGDVTPAQCYATSLLLGTSYAGTARHLETAHLIDRQVSAALMRVPPGRIKKSLDVADAPPRDPRADVWRLAEVVDFEELVFAEGDRIVVDATGTAELLGAQLVDLGLAEPVWQSREHSVLVAVAKDIADETDHRSMTPLCHHNGEIPARVDRVLKGLSDPSSIPDLSTMSDEEIDALYQTQEQIFHEIQGDGS
ncbi:ImmA/IrrE family metallo-endopeptidase [Amycolatopsis sp. cmx-4-61]|uniref:ImmA/IrrE family metallo-endopeptidase n=1 Tax=Amycolatopsis sp. cmx-4-61 TaxID=2790937 RepID=UPI003979E09B